MTSISKNDFKTLLRSIDREMTLERLLKRKTAGSWLVQHGNRRILQVLVESDFKLFDKTLTFAMTALRKGLTKAFVRSDAQSIECFKTFPPFVKMTEGDRLTNPTGPITLFVDLALTRAAVAQAMNTLLKTSKESRETNLKFFKTFVSDPRTFSTIAIETGLFALTALIADIERELQTQRERAAAAAGSPHIGSTYYMQTRRRFFVRFLKKKSDGHWLNSAEDALKMFKLIEEPYKLGMRKLPYDDMWMATYRGIYDKPLIKHILEKRQRQRVLWRVDGGADERQKEEARTRKARPDLEEAVMVQRVKLNCDRAVQQLLARRKAEPRSWLAGENVSVELCDFVSSYWDSLDAANSLESFGVDRWPRMGTIDAVGLAILSFKSDVVLWVQARTKRPNAQLYHRETTVGAASVLAFRHASIEFIEFICNFFDKFSHPHWYEVNTVNPSQDRGVGCFKPQTRIAAPRFISNVFTGFSATAPLRIATNLTFLFNKYSYLKSAVFLRRYKTAFESYIAWAARIYGPLQLERARVRLRTTPTHPNDTRVDVQYILLNDFIRPLLDALPPRRLLKNFRTTETIRLLKKCEEAVECVICLESIKYDDVHVLTCGHRFCETCLQQVKQPRRCPFCREPFLITFQ